MTLSPPRRGGHRQYPETDHFGHPPDRSLHRNFWGKFKARAKIHLVRLSLHGQWVATGLVGPEGFSALGDTPKEAWAAVAAKQVEWWSSNFRPRDIP